MSTSPQYASGPTTPVRHRPNVLFLLSGLLLIIVGVGMMVFGFLFAVLAVLAVSNVGPQLSDLGAGPDARSDLEPMMNGFVVAVVGCTVLTVGRYLWRGARRRGWRDRVGRSLIIAGYLVITAALYVLTRFVLEALAADDPGESGQIVFSGLLVCAAIMLPGVLLALPGFRLAKEKPLMKVEVKASI
jgi:hypothetical protein